MREIEFLPAWYPRLRERKRMVSLQAWVTVVLLSGLCLWGWLSGRNIRSASASLTILKGQLNQTDSDLQKLEEQVQHQKALQAKDQILAKLGRHVEATRCLRAVEDAMPPEMSMVSFSAEIEEVARPVAPGGALAAERVAQSGAAATDRRLRLKVVGVGPTDGTVAAFMDRLVGSGQFDRVAMSYTRERIENNHEMREFEVTFCVDLNPAATGAF